MQILDLEVSFTVGKLLVSPPAVKKKFIKAISGDEAIQFCLNTFDSTEVIKTPTLYSCYFIEALKRKVCLEKGLKIIARLDTSAEIHVMIRELVKNVNLAIK